MRLTQWDRVRSCYTIRQDAPQGMNIQKLGRLEDRDEVLCDEYRVDINELEYECGKCHGAVGHSYNFCPWCGQRVKEGDA